MWLLDVLMVVGGYAASVYTWPWIRTKFTGVEAEISSLIAKVEALVPHSKVTVTPVAPPVSPVATTTAKSS